MPLYDIEVQAVFEVKVRVNAETKKQAEYIAKRVVSPRISNAVDTTDDRIVDYEYCHTPAYTQINPDV